MCGIAAQYGHVDAEAGERMLDRLVHRGPDDHGSAQIGGHWLGHRRLSIVDVDGGAQPLGSNGTRLVGNGEVYNHDELRERLGPSRFATDSDNEVALHLLEDEGPHGLRRLEGMYAFVLAGADGSFVAARDPVGIKPLYWANGADGSVRFASEIRAFDREWLPRVRAFPPGHHWTPEHGLRRFARAAPKDVPEPPAAGAEIPPEAIERVRHVFVDSVERQMMGDVPVGVFLSGGLDSSLVAAIAARHLARHGERLKTFAVGLEDSPDLLAARQVARHLGTDHRESVYTAADAIEALPEVVRCIESFDPSLVRSAVPNHLLARLTARHVKVVLTGEGADELFAGYEYLREFSDPVELHDELVRTVEGLHNLNLQRCDRVTMAHGLEARVPFLDTQVIRMALALPAEWKAAGPGRPEKLILRQAFEGWLPGEFLWREKAQFGDGSGAASVLTDHFAAGVTDADLAREAHQASPPIRTREELAYWRIFRERLAGVATDGTIGRFATA